MDLAPNGQVASPVVCSISPVCRGHLASRTWANDAGGWEAHPPSLRWVSLSPSSQAVRMLPTRASGSQPGIPVQPSGGKQQPTDGAPWVPPTVGGQAGNGKHPHRLNQGKAFLEAFKPAEMIGRQENQWRKDGPWSWGFGRAGQGGGSHSHFLPACLGRWSGCRGGAGSYHAGPGES